MSNNNLHSIIKLQDDIEASKWLSVFLPKEKRQQIKELEAKRAELDKQIDGYLKELGLIQ